MKPQRWWTHLVPGLALVLLAGGGGLAMRAGYMHAKAQLARHLIADAYQQRLLTGQSPPPWPWADTVPVARLRIPALHYDEVVLEGASMRAMAFGPTRAMNSARPGEPGNVVLAGHRNNWFAPLEGIGVGMAVILSWPAQGNGFPRSQRYRVEAIDVVDEADVRYVQPTPEDVLTLITCYPFVPTPHSRQRMIVRALPWSGPAVGSTEQGCTPGHGEQRCRNTHEQSNAQQVAALQFTAGERNGVGWR